MSQQRLVHRLTQARGGLWLSAAANKTSAHSTTTRLLASSHNIAPASSPSSHSSALPFASFQRYNHNGRHDGRRSSGHRVTGGRTRTAGDDYEWDKLRKAKDPFLTMLDPNTNYPTLPLNEYELNSLSFKYGLRPLPTLTDRVRKYQVEQSYYDRRDHRIRQHLDRLLRMKRLSKKEMLILIDQVESAHWNLAELQKAYIPETHHAEKDEELAHRKALQVGTGGVAYKAAYKKAREEKEKEKAGKPPKVPEGDGTPKYGYRRDLVNMGPEHWDYLTPYMILEPEARHLSHLDGAFKYEDRYVLWEEEHRMLALAAKLQRMKMLGIPLSEADSLATPESLKRDHMFPNARIRRALVTHLEKGKPIDSKEFWSRYHARSRADAAANARLLARKEAKTMTAARRNIPEYIKRFEREVDQPEIDQGAQTILAQNVYLREMIEKEKKKPSLLTPQQQASCKALLGMMATRNRVALKKIYLSARTQWETLMIERALERKYLQIYNTVDSDFMNSSTLLKLEKELMEVVADYWDKFEDRDDEMDAINLRNLRLRQQDENVAYTQRYIQKMEEFMENNAESLDDYNVNAGGREWINDMLDWEDEQPKLELEEAKQKQDEMEKAELDRELDTWNEFFDVQVATELAHMVDSGEIVNEANIEDGAVELAEKRVSMRLNATRQEWKSWKLRPQYTNLEDMYAPPADPKRGIIESTEVVEKKTPGQQIIAEVLKTDKMMKASQKFKKRMAPTLALIDQADRDSQPGSQLNALIGGEGGQASAGNGNGEGAGVGDDSAYPDASLSTSGHKILNMDDPAERRRALEHSKELGLTDETLRFNVEDPFVRLLNEHALNSRDGRTQKSSGDSSSSSSGDRNEVDTTDPRLGFPDDDFRLYDPVLTKAPDSNQKSTSSGEVSMRERKAREIAFLKSREGDEDIFGDTFTDPVYWIKEQDRAHRKKHFLDLDPFGPSNTDERRDFDDTYTHLDEEDYAYKKRVDPETDHQKPLTQQYVLDDNGVAMIQKFDLNDETQELLYMLHRSDPVKYHPRYLANKFKLSAQRVKSCLIVQAIHHRMVANGVIHPLAMEYSEERALEDLVRPPLPMIHDVPELDYQFLPDYRWVREDDLHRVLDEEKSIEDRFLSRGQRLDKAEKEYYAKWGAIGTEPPAEPSVQPLLDQRLMAPTHHNICMIDISELPSARYGIAIRHRDGTLREPDEKTYQFVRKREKGDNHFVYVKYHKEDVPM